MKARANEVDARIARPDASVQIFLIYGPDRGLVRERAERLAGTLVENPDDPFGVTRLSDEDIKADPAALADAMAALSLMGGDRLVRLRLSGESAATTNWLKTFIAGEASAEARLIIEAGDLKKNSKLRKTCEDAKACLALPCYADNARTLLELAERSFEAEGLTLAPDARSLLAPLLEGDRMLARGEIEKLLLFKGLATQRGDEPATITREDVTAISAAGAEAALDQAIDPALSGDPASADRGYARALASGSNAIGVLRALQRKIEQIDLFHSLGASDAALARSGAPRFGPPADRFKQMARLWSGGRLDQARAMAFKTERDCKRSGAPVEALTGALLLRLARAAAQSRG
ncbi:MAG: DNA polymerase III subunit delta [Pseudomonadota bacterium]